MPCLVVEKLEEKDSAALVKIPDDILNKYPSFSKLSESSGNVNLRIYLNRVYNERGEVIEEYKLLFTVPLKVYKYQYYKEGYADFSHFHITKGIPIGYFAEFLLLNFVIKSEDKAFETPIFPNEFRVMMGYVPDSIKEKINSEQNALKKVGADFEVIGLLYNYLDLHEIAGDLSEALTRFYETDYEGSIKFFRKVVEGLKNFIEKNKIIPSKNRHEALDDYLKKAFHLISNFGEHAGTHGFMSEAIFSKDIAISACRYVISYLKRK